MSRTRTSVEQSIMAKIVAVLAVAAISGFAGYQWARVAPEPAEVVPAVQTETAAPVASPRVESQDRLTQQAGTTCRTPAGQCPTPPAPIGAPCMCNGVQGQVGG